MDWVVTFLWLIPALPLAAAGVSALLRRSQRRLAAGLAVGSMAIALVLALLAFDRTLGGSAHGAVARETGGFAWFTIGDETLRLGWVLDPLTAVMLVMVTLVGLLIFVYSVGYMAQDDNVTRFFCFLSLFAAAMLGLVIANSLLLLFVCWELVGLASYLLIGFWYATPSAAAAAKKAFITTRIGDLGFLLGMVWLYGQTGTLLFYDDGQGCLEPASLGRLATTLIAGGMAVSTAIALLLFCGAIGKSGQFPLHVWLPDAMEGPTPVSALIHAATMVAAGVFLVARVYPLMAAHGAEVGAATTALQVVTWVGALTAVFAASIAVAQTDIKRILAYSTVSQLGFMMLGLGVGGVAVGMFHLITHAFFKALLFLGAGSVIHGVHGEQDVRRMGGLRGFMPVTFATYAVGMMALAGVPLVFSGFWSKDEILHAAHGWEVSRVPFYLGLIGALLTAFYMTRQMSYVFLGTRWRGAPSPGAGGRDPAPEPHESPAVMTVPLVVLAVFAVGLGFAGTPAWPGFQAYLTGEELNWAPGKLAGWDHLSLMLGSSLLVLGGIGLGWRLYGNQPITRVQDRDPFERRWPMLYRLWGHKYYVDELYEATVIRWNQVWAGVCDWLDRWVWGGLVAITNGLAVGLAWASRFVDEWVVNVGFDEVCGRLRRGGRGVAGWQDGQVQSYLRALALGLALLMLLLIWGGRG